MIIVDELHWLSDPQRGYLLELLLTKIIYFNTLQKTQSNIIRIVGMSATIPNLPTVARWLNADYYETTYRPVPLIEYIKFGNNLYDADMVRLRSLQSSQILDKDDTEQVSQLCWEIIKDKHSVLIFCTTKAWCETLATLLAKNFYNVIYTHNLQKNPFDTEQLSDIFEQLKRTPAGLDKILAKTIIMGVAFHHAGLTMDEREIIENGYRSNIIRIIVCTSTLANGVNLPARRVIIRSPLGINGKVIDVGAYKQMIGRAGRKGLDDSGESIIICKKEEVLNVQSLMKQAMVPIRSCFYNHEHKTSLKRALLEIITSSKANSACEIISYMKCTFYYSCLTEDNTKDNNQMKTIVDTCLEWLVQYEFVIVKNINNDEQKEYGSMEIDDIVINDKQIKQVRYEPTQLAYACINSSLSPDNALVLLSELNKAQRSFVLENDLHILYLIIPFNLVQQLGTLEWKNYHEIWERMSVDLQCVGKTIGINENALFKKAAGHKLDKREYDESQDCYRYARFYIALILNDLLLEIPMNKLINKYMITKGFIQSLQQATAAFTGIVETFCDRLGWANLKRLLSGFQARINFGVREQLCDLVRISLINGLRARYFYENNFKTVMSIANADVNVIEKILQKSIPFQTLAQKYLDENIGQSRNYQCIFVPGRAPLTNSQAAVEILNEAKSLVKDALNDSGFKIVVQKKGTCIKTKVKNIDRKWKIIQIKSEAKKILFLEQTQADDNTSDSSDDDDEEEEGITIDLVEKVDIQLISYMKQQESIDFSDLVKDKSIRIRNCYIDDFDKNGKKMQKLCSRFASLIETKTTFSIACLTKTHRILNNTSNFCINQENELKLYYVACAWSIHKIYIISIEQDEQFYNIHKMSALMYVKRALLNDQTKLISFSCLNTMFMLCSYLALPRCSALLIDIQICAWLTQNLISNDRLRQWTQDNISFVDVDETFSNIAENDNVNISDCKEVACETLFCLSLVTNLETRLRQSQLWMYYKRIEMPSLNIILNMLLNGILLKRDYLFDEREHLLKLLNQLEMHAFRLLKRRFKFHCRKDLLKILYGELNLPEQRTASGRLSTKKRYLNILALYHPLPQIINEHRQIKSALERCIDVFEQYFNDAMKPTLRFQNEQQHQQYQCLHYKCNFLTSTGRMTVTNPPLQHVPKTFSIKSLNENNTVELRKMIVARDGFKLVSIDYSQLELRILAHLSVDIKLQERLNDPKFDFFMSLASHLLNKSIISVTEDERQNAKQICYGIVYGMSTETFAKEANMTQNDAETFIENFYQTFPVMKKYLDDLKIQLHLIGEVKSLFGRKMLFDCFKSSSIQYKARIERQAVNFVIQSSACDVMKMAMQRLTHSLDREYPFDVKSQISPPYYLILQLHDELLFEIDEQHLTKIIGIIQSDMLLNRLDLELPVKIKVGQNWGQMKCFNSEI
ncbi:unnamed protein product, partial [Didymodactylos carnosus]